MALANVAATSRGTENFPPGRLESIKPVGTGSNRKPPASLASQPFSPSGTRTGKEKAGGHEVRPYIHLIRSPWRAGAGRWLSHPAVVNRALTGDGEGGIIPPPAGPSVLRTMNKRRSCGSR